MIMIYFRTNNCEVKMINKKKIYGSIAIMGITSMLSPLAVAADVENENTSSDTAVTNEDPTASDNEKESGNENSEKDQESTENKDSTNEKGSENEEKTEGDEKPSEESEKENNESSEVETPGTTTLPDGKFAVKLSMLNEKEFKCIDQSLTNNMKETLNQSSNQEENDTNQENPSEALPSETESESKPTKEAEESPNPSDENNSEEKGEESETTTSENTEDSETTTSENTEAERLSSDALSVDTYANEEENTNPKDEKEGSPDNSDTPTEKESDNKVENENPDTSSDTDNSSDKESSTEENASSNIKVDLTKPSTPGVVLNGAQIQDIQIVDPAEGEKVTIEGLPEGLQYDAKSGTITGTPNVELQPNEEEKVFDLKISGTDSASIKSITIFKDDNNNGISDKDENNDSITLEFELDKGTLYISSPTGTKISDVTIDEEGYLVSKGARVKEANGKEVRVIGEDGKLISPETTLPISTLVDIEKTANTQEGTVNDEKVAVDLGCLASLIDVENVENVDNVDNNSQKPKVNFPSSSSSSNTHDPKESSEKDNNKEEEKSDESNKNGAKVINGESSREPNGYQNDSEKYTPTLQNLDAGGRLIGEGSGPKGPKVDTGGAIETSLLVKLVRLIQDSF